MPNSLRPAAEVPVDRILPGTIVILVLLTALAGMALAWRARRRRQKEFDVRSTVPADLGETRYSAPVAYVATTPAGAPLERLAVAGLAYRGPAHLTATASGVVLDLAGEEPRFIGAADLRGAGRATWAIDRVVETDGLVMLGWRLAGRSVDTYLRPEDETSARALVAAISEITPATVTEESEV
jgi:hypothetical protein